MSWQDEHKTGRGRPWRRRDLLRLAAGASLSLPLARWGGSALWAAEPDKKQVAATASGTGVLTGADDQLLEEIERANFLYFWEQSNPQTGLIKDRCNVRANNDTTVAASIAATGFGLTALCIGEKRGYVSLNDARNRALTMLRFLSLCQRQHRGTSVGLGSLVG
jgi:hypothetical protein